MPHSASGSRWAAEGQAELNLYLVAELERAEERRVRLDPPLGLGDDGRPLRPVAVQPALHGQRPGRALDGQVPVDAEPVLAAADAGGGEGDLRVAAGLQDLLQGP